MLVNFRPAIANNQRQSTSFKALPVSKITSSVNAAEIFRIQARGGKLYPNTLENQGDLLSAIGQAKDIGVKVILTDVAQNVWKCLKK